VEEFKTPIAIHPHGPQGKGKHRWYSAQTIMAAVKDHHPLIGSCLDTGHLIRMAQLNEPLDPVEQIQIMGKRNFGLHLKDHDNVKKQDVVFGSASGKLDVLAVLKELKKQEFKGYLSIEYETNPEEPTADVEACVKYFNTTLTKLS
jgi:inosose dehydratase